MSTVTPVRAYIPGTPMRGPLCAAMLAQVIDLGLGLRAECPLTAFA